MSKPETCLPSRAEPSTVDNRCRNAISASCWLEPSALTAARFGTPFRRASSARRFSVVLSVSIGAVSFPRGRNTRQRSHGIDELFIPNLVEDPELESLVRANAPASVFEERAIGNHRHEGSLHAGGGI